MSAPYALLFLSSLCITSLSAMSSMEFVHNLIRLDHRVYSLEDTRVRQASLAYNPSVDAEENTMVVEPTFKRRTLVRFIPNHKKMTLSSESFKVLDYSHNGQNYPISLPLCSLIKHRWNISSMPTEIVSLDDFVGYNGLVMDENRAVEPVTIRATFRESGTSIDINYQPLSSNVEVLSRLSVKRHKSFLKDMLKTAADDYSTLEVVTKTEDGSPEHVQIISRYSLQDFASLINSSQPSSKKTQ